MPDHLAVSESCLYCPHFDEFHGSCTHPLRQSVINELAAKESEACPVFPKIRSEVMQDLAEQNIA